MKVVGNRAGNKKAPAGTAHACHTGENEISDPEEQRMPQGKPVALITGAATGIGRAAAVALAAAGYDVVINYSRSEQAARETASLAQAKGAKTLLFKCDVSNAPSVRKMLAAVEKEFGRLDALVNNAGTTSNVKPADFEAMNAEEWDRVFAVHVR